MILAALRLMPFTGLAVLDGDRDGLAADDLAETAALPDVVGALLDGCPIRGAADDDRVGGILLVFVRQGVRVWDKDACGQAGEGGVELGF